MKKITLYFLGVVLSLNLVYALIFFEKQTSSSLHYQTQIYKDVLRLLKEHGISKEVSYEDLSLNALNLLLQSVNKYNGLYPPLNNELSKSFNSGKIPSFAGISWKIDQEKIYISSILKNSFYDQYKIPEDCQVVSINNKLVTSTNFNDILLSLKNEMNLTVMKDNKKTSFLLPILPKSSIKKSFIKDDIGYIYLARFVETSSQDFAQKLLEMQQKNIKALIIDLRGNPGGFVKEAVKIAGYFLDNHTLVSYSLSHNKEKKEYFTQGNKKSDLEIIILQDHYSASAAELFASALQSHKRAKIIGDVSYGKGSIQTIFNLKHNYSLHLTTAYYYSPNDERINDRGVIPDVDLKQDKATQDKIVVRMLTSKEPLKDDEAYKIAYDLLKN